jgi:heme-degrading monooxygenase HmoA
MFQGAVLLHVWLVDPEQEAAGIARLEALFAQIHTDPGFISARILESKDRESVAAVIEMRSAEDHERLERLPDVRETLDRLHGAASLTARLYHEVKTYPA